VSGAHTTGSQCAECGGFCLNTPVTVMNILNHTDDHLQALQHYGHSRDLRQATGAVRQLLDSLAKLADAVETRKPEHEGYLSLCAAEARAALALATGAAS
jgi:hypothetical protein